MEESDEINFIENQLVTNAAMQLNNIRREYHPLRPLEDSDQFSTSPPITGQAFRLWQQQQQYLFQQQHVNQQQQRSSSRSSLQEQDYIEPSHQESFSNEEKEESIDQSITSPLGSEPEDLENSSLSGRLVDLMPDYPCLWNTHLRSYKDLNLKDQSWKELQAKLKAPGM